MAPTIVASVNSGTFSGTRTISTGTITGWTPQANDVVVILVNLIQAGTVTFSPPSDWVMAAVGEGGGPTMGAVYHLVTQAEATAATTSWSLSNLLDQNEQGRRIAFVVRGANPAAPVDVAAGGGASTNTCVIPGLTPTKSDGLVVGGGGGNSVSTSATYTMPGAPWSLIQGQTSGTNICFGIQNSTPTTAGVAYSGANIGISRVDGWASVAVAFAPAPSVGSGAFFAIF